MKMSKIKIYINLIIITIICYSCCDCLNEESEPKKFCDPREATITEFYPLITQNVTTDPDGNQIISYQPTDSYSIHGFKFPDSRNSSGELPVYSDIFDAERGKDRIAVIEEALPNPLSNNYPLFLAILDNFPKNEDLKGDLLVTDVDISDPNNRRARIRFSGWLQYVDTDPSSESSREHCEYYENNFEKANYSDRLFRYGALDFKSIIAGEPTIINLTDNFGANRTYPTTVDNSIVSLIDINGYIIVNDVINPTNRIIGGPYPMTTEINLMNQINQEIIASNLGANIQGLEEFQIINNSNVEVYDIEVIIGDYFFYRAINGKDFLMKIINIDERPINPDKKRVSIIFNEI